MELILTRDIYIDIDIVSQIVLKFRIFNNVFLIFIINLSKRDIEEIIIIMLLLEYILMYKRNKKVLQKKRNLFIEL